ncbi:hypothetical protein [Kitasatospora sp. NPDC059599]|uniref:hypothetical protein n=1 Tax=Kitasatospora sp. NPDC059599 TaxID=3346880 RepID=UPI0036B90149
MDHDQGERHDGEQPARPGRVHFRRSARNPNGSTAPLRADVLAALGVLKIATYKQLHALIAADEYRDHHRVEHVAEAVRDLEKHKLVDVRGATSPPGRRPAAKAVPAALEGAARPKPGGPGAEKIVGLTLLGLAAAAEALGDDRDMGGHARGAGLTGAPHAMLVNEFIITAVTGTTTHGAPPRTDKRQAPPRRVLPAGPLPGGIEAWATETPHTITGKFNVIPDAIVRLPELGIPVWDLIDQRRQARQAQDETEKQRAEKAEQDAADARQRVRLLAARAHNDTLHPCYTCHGPLGGAHDAEDELNENAEPDRLECPACLADRRGQNGRPIVLDLPSPRDLKMADKHGPPTKDPWWTVRIIHAQRWPKAKRDSGNVPELWPNARA